MPPENRFSAYLDDRDNLSSRYSQRIAGMHLAQDDQESSSRRLKLGIGLGLLTFGAYRAGMLRSVTSNLMEGLSQIRGTRLQSLLEGGRSWLSQSPPIPGVRLGQFRLFDMAEDTVNVLGVQFKLGRPVEALRSLSDHVSRSYERLSAQHSQPLSGQISAFEKYAKRFAAMRANYATQASYAIRYNRMLRDVQGTDLYESFVRMSRADGADSEWFSRVSKTSFRRRFEKDFGKEQVDQIWNIIRRYQAPSGSDDTALFHFRGIDKMFSDKEQSAVRRAAERGSRQLDQALIEALRVNEEYADRFLKRTGLRQATIGDLFDRGLIRRSADTAQDQFDIAAEVQRLRKEYGRDTIDKLSAGRGLYINRSGNLVDIRHIRSGITSFLSGFGDHFQIPIVNINPIRMAHIKSIEDAATQNVGQWLSRGALHPGIGGSQPLGEDVVFAAGRAFSLMDPDRVLAENIYMVSSKYGPTARALPKMGGHTNIVREKPSSGLRRHMFSVGEFLDIGMQEQPNALQKVFGIITKTLDDRWEGNWIRNLQTASYADIHQATKILDDVTDFADSRTKALSATVFNKLKPQIDDAYSKFGINIDLSSDEAVIRTLENLVTRDGQLRESSFLTEQYFSRLKGEWNKYIESPEDYLNRLRVFSNKSPIERLRNTEVISSIDDLRKLIQKETIARTAMMNQGSTPGFSPMDIIKSEFDRMNIGKSEYSDALDFLFSMSLDKSSSRVTEDLFRQMATEGTYLHSELSRFRAKHAPMWQMGRFNTPDTENFFGPDSSVAMRRFVRPPAWRDVLAAINGDQIARARVKDNVKSMFSQFTAGRDNFEDITTATFFPYYFFERLNEALQPFGLALSNQSLGSAGSIFRSFLLKRALPVMAGTTYLGYLNWEVENLTGVNPRDQLLEGVKEAHLTYASFTDTFGITEWAKRQSQLMPGFHEYTSEIPILGYLDPTRTEQELEDWYERGYEPVRKGRWWTLGNTPFIGGKVEYFQPNYVIRGQSDYKMTDSLYGSEEEYFANHWLPTPRYPFAPVRHFITDPYHWEDKHYYTRPYPVTGPIPELAEMPLIGPALTPISNMLKPPRRMHEEELAAINQYEMDRASQPKLLYAYVTPSGQIGIREWSGDVMGPPGVIAMPREGILDGQQIVVGGVGTGAGAGDVATINAQIMADASSPTGLPEYQEQLAHINHLIQLRAQGQKQPGGVLLPARGMMPYFEASVQDPMEISDPRWAAGRLFYNFTEMGGFYGWSLTNVTGGDIFDDMPIVQDSHRMTSYERSFWDLNLGGFGGGLSEIFRRFIPHRRRQIDEWNPIPNEMPGWLPGENYFINFQEGDPYLKVAKGEMRLPGPGYEAVYDLHPDQFGEYGAFDRFKILADVAPYSREYRYWSSIVSQMDLPPEMRAEVREIRERVSEVKERRRFFNYRFLYADLRQEQVTVTRVLSNSRFLTEEYPDHPIELAGVKISNAATADPEMVDAIRNVIYPGARITIGVTADDINLINQDTYRSIDAVVYSGRTNLNRMLIEQGLAPEDERDDSVAGIHARFTPSEIREGSMWEWLLHRDTMFHTKLMQVRSPLEDYMRRQVYGKDWQTWEDPIEDYLIPTYESYIDKSPPLAIALGAFIGSRFGADKLGRRIGGIVGGTIMGLGSTYRMLEEVSTGERYIPTRRLREREVEEYFDILEYLKYRGLYERYADLAQRYEGANMESYVDEIRGEGSARKRRIKELERMKRQAKLAGDEELVSELTAEINRLKGYRKVEILGPYSAKALMYKQAYESTMYGADPYGSMQNIFRSLPKKERDYFNEFLDAPAQEREEILRVVPSYVRRFLQARWGMEVDEKPDLATYFTEHYLPPAYWEGWEEGKSLEDIKIRVVKNEALDTSEFDIWPDDERRAEENNAPAWDINRRNIRPSALRKQIEAILLGQGLDNVTVEIIPSEEAGIFIDMDINRDRREEIRRYLNHNMGAILGG